MDTERFERITQSMLRLYKAKNADYGGSVSSTYKTFGLTAFLVRMQDKMNRLITLSQNEKQAVTDEKIEDTLLDLANYAILALIEREKEAEEKNGNTTEAL